MGKVTGICRPRTATRSFRCSSSMLHGRIRSRNLVEVWFGIIERQAIHWDFINGWNPRAQPFVWTKTAEQILTKADRKQLQTRASCRWSEVRERALRLRLRLSLT